MKIGILGGGHVGGTLGKGWAAKGHEIMFGVRKPDAPDMQETLKECGGNARAASAEEAAAFGEVIVNALPWPPTKDVLSQLNLSGKPLLDASNPLAPDMSKLEVGTTSSAGEQVAQWAKGAKVVKIFNTTGANNMAAPAFNGKPITMLYCGDDKGAKDIAAQLAKDIGFDPVDCGPLSNARTFEPIAFLWIWLAFNTPLGRDFAFQIVPRNR